MDGTTAVPSIGARSRRLWNGDGRAASRLGRGEHDPGDSKRARGSELGIEGCIRNTRNANPPASRSPGRSASPASPAPPAPAPPRGPSARGEVLGGGEPVEAGALPLVGEPPLVCPPAPAP